VTSFATNDGMPTHATASQSGRLRAKRSDRCTIALTSGVYPSFSLWSRLLVSGNNFLRSYLGSGKRQVVACEQSSFLQSVFFTPDLPYLPYPRFWKQKTLPHT